MLQKIACLILIGLTVSVARSDSLIDAKSVIVLGANHGSVERHAANELQAYIASMLNGSIQLSDSIKEGCIVLGTSKSNNIIHLLESQLKLPQSPQGFTIMPVVYEGKSITIIASVGEVGVLYGVYDLLEEMGVHFLCEGDNVIPRLEAYKLTREFCEKPAFPKRAFPMEFSSV